MRRFKLLAIIAIPWLIVACDQRPIDLGPESTGMEWRRVVEFRSRDSEYDRPAVWASNPTNVYVLSGYTNPGFQHFDGTSWTAVSFQPNSRYYGDVWGSGPSDIYVTDRTLHHFDGSSWTDTGIPAGRMSGSSTSNFYLFSDSLMLRFNGATWDTLRTIPPNYQIRDISAYGASGAFFAARDSLLQWENHQWKAFKAPALADRVVAFDDGTCVVSTFDNSYVSGFWRFNNGVWTQFADPFTNAFVDDMWGSGFSSLWVTNSDRLYHYDGNSWSVEDVPTNTALFTVWGTGDSDIYAGGGGGVTLHDDGASWRLIRSGVPGDAYSIVAKSPSDFLIGANNGTVYHYLEGAWTEQPLPDENWQVTALAGSGTNLFAGTRGGRVYQFDGSNWALSADSLGELSAGVGDLATISDGGAYAVGYRFISQFDGNVWRQTYSGQNHFQQVWAASKSIAFATAYEGVFQFDGTGWKRVLEKTTAPFQGIWGSAADDVYVTGGGVTHFDGHTWRRVFPGGSDKWIAGIGAEDVVTYSDFGMARFDGRIWRWSSDRSDQAIDLVPTRSGHILRMYAQYPATDVPPYIVISERVAP